MKEVRLTRLSPPRHWAETRQNIMLRSHWLQSPAQAQSRASDPASASPQTRPALPSLEIFADPFSWPESVLARASGAPRRPPPSPPFLSPSPFRPPIVHAPPSSVHFPGRLVVPPPEAPPAPQHHNTAAIILATSSPPASCPPNCWHAK
jgi:hypothetical protein